MGLYDNSSNKKKSKNIMKYSNAKCSVLVYAHTSGQKNEIEAPSEKTVTLYEG